MKKSLLLLALLIPACGPAPDSAPPAEAAPPAPAAPAPSTSPAAPAEASPGANDPAEAEDLEALTRKYFAWLQEGNWEAISAIFHPDSLAEFRSIVGFLEKSENHPGVIQMRPIFFGPDATTAGIAALTNEAFFSRVMSALMKRPDTAAALNSRTLDVVGWVPAGNDIMHVVTRSTTTADGDTFEIMEVATYRRHGDAWKVLITGRMKNNIRQLRARIENPSGGRPPGAPGPPQQ